MGCIAPNMFSPIRVYKVKKRLRQWFAFHSTYDVHYILEEGVKKVRMSKNLNTEILDVHRRKDAFIGVFTMMKFLDMPGMPDYPFMHSVRKKRNNFEDFKKCSTTNFKRLFCIILI